MQRVLGSAWLVYLKQFTETCLCISRYVLNDKLKEGPLKLVREICLFKYNFSDKILYRCG